MKCYPQSESQKQVVNLLERLTGKYCMWEIWQDFIIMSACAIAMVFPAPNLDKKVAEYQSRVKKYSPEEMKLFAEAFNGVVDAMERHPEQDFLGELFMSLGINNRWKGQFFTPYNICSTMAAMILSNDLEQQAEKQDGWISVNDPACGAGALLVAFANECHKRDFNDQIHVLYVAQDIDFLAGCMCYIQLSLMGCPGYVVIGDSILNPVTSIDPRGLIPEDEGNIWYTPMYFSSVWQWRIILARIALVGAGEGSQEPAEPKPQELHEKANGQLVLF